MLLLQGSVLIAAGECTDDTCSGVTLLQKSFDVVQASEAEIGHQLHKAGAKVHDHKSQAEHKINKKAPLAKAREAVNGTLVNAIDAAPDQTVALMLLASSAMTMAHSAAETAVETSVGIFGLDPCLIMAMVVILVLFLALLFIMRGGSVDALKADPYSALYSTGQDVYKDPSIAQDQFGGMLGGRQQGSAGSDPDCAQAVRSQFRCC